MILTPRWKEGNSDRARICDLHDVEWSWLSKIVGNSTAWANRIGDSRKGARTKRLYYRSAISGRVDLPSGGEITQAVKKEAHNE
jgi:hypothetical protein